MIIMKKKQVIFECPSYSTEWRNGTSLVACEQSVLIFEGSRERPRVLAGEASRWVERFSQREPARRLSFSCG